MIMIEASPWSSFFHPYVRWRVVQVAKMSDGPDKQTNLSKSVATPLSKARQGFRFVVVLLEQLHEIGHDQQIVKPLGGAA